MEATFSFYKNEAKTNKRKEGKKIFPNFMILLRTACRVTHVTNIHQYGTLKTFHFRKNFTTSVVTGQDAKKLHLIKCIT